MKFKFPKYLKYLKCKEEESRGVYESGCLRVGFVPNPDSTRHYRVGKILTRSQPAGSFRSTGLGRIGFRVWIDRFWVFQFTGFWPKSGQIYESWARFLWIYENLAELESGLPEFWLSLSKSWLVCQNLAYLSKEEARSWSDLSRHWI